MCPRKRTGGRPITRCAILIAAAIALAVPAVARADVAPPTNYPLTAAAKIFRTQTYRLHPCLARIIDLENGWWDPTVDNGGGHGNVYESYGLPQATPGTKMASAGRDWRTSRATQLRWMVGYTVAKFGSECNAYWSRVHNRTY